MQELDNMTIRESILFYQDKQGISDITVCETCNINKSSYSLFRNNIRNLPYEKLQAVMNMLKLKITEQ